MSEVPAARRFAWYGIGSADLVFLIMALAIFQQSRNGMVDDPGLGWHIRDIDAMREEGGWLRQDPFSGPRAGAQWYTNQWLGDLILWAGNQWAGLDGIAAVTTLTLAFLCRCLYRSLLVDGLAWPVAALWTLLAALATAASWPARPNIFTLLFLFFTAQLCMRFCQGACSRRRMLWLLPLFALWANTHGGFVAGLITIGTTTIVEGAIALGASDAATRRACWNRFAFLVGLSGLAFLATLVNPYGLALYPWIFRLVGNPFFMNLNVEWLSPNFHNPGAFRYELLILLCPVVLVLSRRPTDLVSLGLTVVWLHLALNGGRYVALWVLVVVPILARASVEIPWLRERIGRLPFSKEMWRLLGPLPGKAPWLASAFIVLAFLAWTRWIGGTAQHNPEFIPATALNKVLEVHDREVVFHDYSWGGFLTWHGWPRFRTWIDDRNEVQGQEHIEEYFRLLQTEPGWEERLQRHHVEIICIRPNTPLAFRLSESKDAEWSELYRDDYAVIFRRRKPIGSENAGLP